MRVNIFVTIGLAIVLAATSASAARAGQTLTIPATATTPPLPAYVAYPSGVEREPAIVVLHGCEGYRNRYGRIADDLAAAGYVAVAIDTLTPRGVTNSCRNNAGSRIEATDALATLAWLRAQPRVDPERLGILGFSMGAIAGLDVADPFTAKPAPAGLRAVVAYYPACRNRTAANAVVPILILDGSADDWTPAAPCAALAAAQAAVPIAITTYPGATHAFNVRLPNRSALGHPLRYDATATADARTQMLAFFGRLFAR